jgi:hypothetical protein
MRRIASSTRASRTPRDSTWNLTMRSASGFAGNAAT